jgi:flagellar motor switch protein FliN/FliY
MTQIAKQDGRQSLYDIELPVTIVVGRLVLSLQDLKGWEPDSIVALNGKTDEPVELCIDGKVVATGELCEGDAGPGSLAVRILDIATDTD